MIDLFDIYQHGKIRDAAAKADFAKDQAQQVVDTVRRLEKRADALALACQALWELLRERTELKDSDLLDRMQEIDLRDGLADGRMTPVPVDCSACGRRSNSRRQDCVYCGARLPGGAAFETL